MVQHPVSHDQGTHRRWVRPPVGGVTLFVLAFSTVTILLVSGYPGAIALFPSAPSNSAFPTTPTAVAASRDTGSAVGHDRAIADEMQSPDAVRSAAGVPTLGFQQSTMSSTAPPGASFGSFAWDPELGEAVYFGGLTEFGPSNETWVLDGGIWLNETNPSHAPAARWGGTLAFDAQSGVQTLVLFGGYGADGPLNDTWLFINGGWTYVAPGGPSPGPLFEASMSNWGSNGTVLFGGCTDSACDQQSNQTWAFQENGSCRGGYGGSCWVYLAVSVPSRGFAPPPVAGAALALDPSFGPSGGTLVLYGGFTQDCSDCARYSNASWYFDGFHWVNATPLFWGQPYPNEPRAFATLFWDPDSDWMYLYGGEGAGNVGISNSLWSSDIDTWVNDSTLTLPNATYGLGVASGVVSGGGAQFPAVVVGGRYNASVAPEGSAWIFEPSVVNEVNVQPASAETNVSVAFYSNSTGGYRPVSSWQLGDGGTLSGGNGTHAYSAAGEYEAVLTATDGYGVQVATRVPVAIHSFELGVQWPTAMDVGTPWNFVSMPTNGTAPFAFNWSFSDGTTSVASAVSHEFAHPGSAYAQLTVRDATGTVVTSRASFNVSASMSGSVTSFPRVVDLGATVLLFGSVSGGSSPFVFNWSLPNGRTALGATIPYMATTVGNFTIALAITDAAGVQWNGSLPLRVNPALTFVAHATTPGLFSGRSVSFGASVTGGTEPYSFEWQFGDGSSSTVPAPTHVYRGSGTFAVNVWVNDSGHGTYHQTLYVKIPHSAGGLIWQLEEWPEWALLALLTGVVLSIVVLATVVRRRAHRSQAANKPRVPAHPPSR